MALSQRIILFPTRMSTLTDIAIRKASRGSRERSDCIQPNMDQADFKAPRKAVIQDRLFYRQFGRLRDIVEGPDGNLYMLTSNRDGRGSPKEDDDRVIRVSFK